MIDYLELSGREMLIQDLKTRFRETGIPPEIDSRYEICEGVASTQKYQPKAIGYKKYTYYIGASDIAIQRVIAKAIKMIKK